MDWPRIAPTRAKQSRCRLLDLPPEIRDIIYEYSLASEKTVVTFRLDSYQRDSYDEATQPALTMVSRQVRRESLPVYFACNRIALHTEGSKAHDARRWLSCNEDHLPKLLRVALWIRYVSLTNDHAASHGALGILLHRFATESHWQVESRWSWITVMRKPAALEDDAEFLIQRSTALLADERTACTSAESFANMMTELRTLYVEKKVS